MYIEYYSVTNESGAFIGYLVKEPNIITWPDTVVAIGPIIETNNGNKQYEWVIEMQCLSKTEFDVSEITFIGLDFYYHYNYTNQTILNDMITTAKQQGLGIYMNPLYYVNQTDCTYP